MSPGPGSGLQVIWAAVSAGRLSLVGRGRVVAHGSQIPPLQRLPRLLDHLLLTFGRTEHAMQFAVRKGREPLCVCGRGDTVPPPSASAAAVPPANQPFHPQRNVSLLHNFCLFIVLVPLLSCNFFLCILSTPVFSHRTVLSCVFRRP